MRAPIRYSLSVAALSVVGVLYVGGNAVRLPAEDRIIAPPFARVLHDIMTCDPQFEWPNESVGGLALQSEQIRTWRVTIYDPANCLREELEQV